MILPLPLVAGTWVPFLRPRVAWALGEIGHGAAAAVPSLQKAASEDDPIWRFMQPQP